MAAEPDVAADPGRALSTHQGWSIRRIAPANLSSAVLALVFVLAIVGFFHPKFLAPVQLINVVQSAVYAALIAAGWCF
jgi:ribose transport system permease protein